MQNKLSIAKKATIAKVAKKRQSKGCSKSEGFGCSCRGDLQKNRRKGRLFVVVGDRPLNDISTEP